MRMQIRRYRRMPRVLSDADADARARRPISPVFLAISRIIPGVGDNNRDARGTREACRDARKPRKDRNERIRR